VATQAPLDWPPHGHTMVGLVRLRNVADILWQVMANAVPGDFAELGVWRGGTCIFAKSILDVMGETRLVHVFDAFGTIPDYSGSAEFLAVRIETVMNGFHMYDAYGSNMSNVFFLQGPIQRHTARICQGTMPSTRIPT